jgi:NTE family protein
MSIYADLGQNFPVKSLRVPATPVFRKKLTGFFLLILFLSGCANYGTPKNVAIPDPREAEKYSLHDWQEGHSSSDLSLTLTFSGGGTRAAALSYGVLEELRDTDISMDGQSTRLLDEVDFISSVSGGSFTSAYYGLHGDGIFDGFEKDFLRFDLQKQLVLKALNPFLLFSKKGRTDSAIAYYQKFLFHDATFADMIRPDRPMILINSSDLGYGIRFSFIQEYFDLLCSELSSYPVADAVAASSAVPIVFNPIVIENFDTCSDMQLLGMSTLRESKQAYHGENLPELVSQLETYADKDKRKFIHFVDGGITDNLGLRAMSDIMAVSGGAEQYLKKQYKSPPRHVVVIMVNAATEPNTNMDVSKKEPSIGGVISAMSGLQLSRYDADSMQLVKTKLEQAAETLSTPEHPVKFHFIRVSLEDIREQETLEYFNTVPTSFSLIDDQVDKLIEAGRELLRASPNFQELLDDIASQ